MKTLNLNDRMKLADGNDAFRDIMCGSGMSSYGKLVITSGVQALHRDSVTALLGKIQRFHVFTDKNDPNSEHDFGKINHDDIDFFWKIDYYDRGYRYLSEDRLDIKKTRRVLTVMRADEY